MLIAVGKKKKNSINYKIVQRAANLLFYVPIVMGLIGGIIAAALSGHWMLLLMTGWFVGSCALTYYASVLKYEHDFGYTILDEDKEDEDATHFSIIPGFASMPTVSSEDIDMLNRIIGK
jgi:hypothetical protein